MVTHPSASELRQSVIRNAKSVVVKVGTRVLTTPDGKLDRDRVNTLARQLCGIADSDRQVVMVSSGAVGAGLGKLGLSVRPTGLAQLQAVAAVGQTDLIQAYETAIAASGRHAAQVLLTRSDLRRRSGYLHVRNALRQIHAFGAIAVVNENDSVAVGELMTTFGDNDRLAAELAGLLNDALLVILSDVDGLFDGSPDDLSSKCIDVVESLSEDIFSLAQDHTGSLSKGGMLSKLNAAKIATSYGHPTIIAPGRDDRVLDKIFAGDSIGTLFLTTEKSIRGRRRWIGTAAKVSGTLHLDAGAARALHQQGRSLLAIGIRQVSGQFKRGSVVAIVDDHEKEIARGLCNYTSEEVEKIKGKASDKITEILGHRPYESVVHRDNMTITK
ncbi:MAG: glutamate 5-kinase [Pirellulaceae bacterium]|nr:glutamate 5-kinase [Pirellulaceae bacterium]